MARKQKSAIIMTSSGLAHFTAPGLLTYSSSKAFISYLGQGLNYELKGKIDAMTFECGEVSTKLLKKKRSSLVLTENPVVTACLRDLGKESLTYGAARHEAIMQPFKIPVFLGLMQKLIYMGTVKALKIIREKEAKAKKDD